MYWQLILCIKIYRFFIIFLLDLLFIEQYFIITVTGLGFRLQQWQMVRIRVVFLTFALRLFEQLFGLIEIFYCKSSICAVRKQNIGYLLCGSSRRFKITAAYFSISELCYCSMMFIRVKHKETIRPVAWLELMRSSVSSKMWLRNKRPSSQSLALCLRSHKSLHRVSKVWGSGAKSPRPPLLSPSHLHTVILSVSSNSVIIPNIGGGEKRSVSSPSTSVETRASDS